MERNERFVMKDISNSDITANPRLFGTPNILSTIRATSTPRVLGTKFFSPNASPVCLSPSIIFEPSNRTDATSHVDVLTYALGKNKLRPNKIFDQKILHQDATLFNSPKSNKRFMHEVASTSSEQHQNKKLHLDLIASDRSLVMDTYDDKLGISNQSMMMDVDLSLATSICMDTRNSSAGKSFSMEAADAENFEQCILTKSESNYLTRDNLNESLIDASNFKRPKITITTLDNFDFKLPQVSMISLDSSDFMLPQINLRNNKSQDESLIMQYPSFELQHSSIDSMNKYAIALKNTQDFIDSSSVPIINQNSAASQEIVAQIKNERLADKDNALSDVNIMKGLNESKTSYIDYKFNTATPLDVEIVEEFVLEQPSNLISDFTRPYHLPYLRNGKHADLKAINPQTANEVLEGTIMIFECNLVFIDCRYPYEFSAGHLLTATNCYKFSDLLNYIKLLDLNLPQIFVFYCEFSSKRAPQMLRQLRKWDRWSNNCHYPRLMFPELYLIEGGYKNIFETSPNACTIPLAYVPMLDSQFEEDLRYYEALKKNEKTKQCKEELKRIFNQARLNRY